MRRDRLEKLNESDTMTKKRINAKIADLGIEVQGRAGDGCYYFTAISTGNALNAESVMVAAIAQLNLSQWRSEAERAVAEDEGDAFVTDEERLARMPKVIVLGRRRF